MMVFAIAISTMITVALVVFAMQYHAYRKNHPKQEKEHARKGATAGAQEAPTVS